MLDLTGTQLGRYALRERLSAGNMASVYRAFDPSIQRDVAIKLLTNTDSHFAARFEREAKVTAALRHPHILKIFDYGSHEDISYLVMEYHPHGTLLGRINQESLSLGTVAQILQQLASALDYAHSKDVIHRDVKPQNILLDEAGNVVLADFGIAQLRDATSSLTRENSHPGTPAYMAPEQITDRKIGNWTDIYALGTVLYVMLTSTVPFDGDTTEAIWYKHLNEPVPQIQKYRSGPTDSIQKVLEKALNKEARLRYATAGALSDAFNEAIQNNSNTPSTAKSALSTSKAARRTSSFIYPDKEAQQQSCRLDAAMPSQTKIGRETEVWVQICLPDSMGFRPQLPQFTKSHEEIVLSDVREGSLTIMFQVDVHTGTLMSSMVSLELRASDFEIREPVQEIVLHPETDSGLLIFRLTPRQAKERSVVSISAKQRLAGGNIVSLGSVSVSTVILPVGAALATQVMWSVVSFPFMAIGLAAKRATSNISKAMTDREGKENRAELMQPDRLAQRSSPLPSSASINSGIPTYTQGRGIVPDGPSPLEISGSTAESGHSSFPTRPSYGGRQRQIMVVGAVTLGLFIVLGIALTSQNPTMEGFAGPTPTERPPVLLTIPSVIPNLGRTSGLVFALLFIICVFALVALGAFFAFRRGKSNRVS